MLRRDPFADVQELLNRMTGLIAPTAEPETDRPWLPVAEIDEEDDAYIVRLELPGVAPDAIDIGIRDSELCVNGEVREEEGGDADRGVLRVRVGRFHYHTSLPSDVDASRVEASMDQGVLRLRVPKAEEAQGRRIPITAGRLGGDRGAGAGDVGAGTAAPGTAAPGGAAPGDRGARP